jgi:hypothetical protein
MDLPCNYALIYCKASFYSKIYSISNKRLKNTRNSGVHVNGEVRVKPSPISKIYHWDGQTLYSNPDFLRDKTSLTSEVPFFCSNFNSKRSSNSTNLLITMASLHSTAAMASFVKLNV